MATPDSDQGSYRWSEILPGGNAVLFTIWAGISEASQIAVLSLDTLEQKVIIQNGSDPSYSPTGHVVYGESGRLWAVPFDLASLEPVSDPLVVLEGVLTKDNTGAVDFSVSNNGTLIFVPGGASSAFQRRLVWVSRDGDEELVPSPPQDYRYVSLSPDGTRAALEIMDNGNVDVWVAELSRGTLTRITTDPLQDQNPLWSPDGRRVLFHSRRSGSAELLWKSADGSGEVEVVATFDAGVVNIRPYSWTPDGTTVAVAPLNQDTGPDIGLLSIDGTGDWEPLIQTRSQEFEPAISPNGRWLAYRSNETGRAEVYVEEFPNLGNRRLVSLDGSVLPTWSGDSRELIYHAPGNPLPSVMQVQIDEPDGDSSLVVGTPETLFDSRHAVGDRRFFDMTPDGERFLMMTSSAETVTHENGGAKIDHSATV